MSYLSSGCLSHSWAPSWCSWLVMIMSIVVAAYCFILISSHLPLLLPLFWPVWPRCCLLSTPATLLFIKTFAICCSQCHQAHLLPLTRLTSPQFYWNRRLLSIYGVPPRSWCLPTLLGFLFPIASITSHQASYIPASVCFLRLGPESKYHETEKYYLLLFPQCLAL